MAPLEPELREGTDFAGYRIHELVGRGGMGVVYRADHLHLQRTVALKLLVPELSAGPEFRERFVREARTAAAIQHPNVVTVYDAGEADGLLYIAMQFVHGTDLASFLGTEGALELDSALLLAEQIAGALDAAHALGVVHRDVKPGNILLDSDRAYLADFGLTRATTSTSGLTVEGQVVGTLDYMSPEQIEGGPLDGRADVYSLGCVLYHCLAGVPPFVKDSQVAMIYAQLQEQPAPLAGARTGVTSVLDDAIARGMAKRTEDRYSSCTELVAAVRRAIEEPASVAVPTGRPTLLVAADESSVRTMIRLSLAESRVAVLEAAGTDEALELARREPPDAVFVDWGPDGAAAATLAGALRSEEHTAGAKIVALVTRGQAADTQALASAGADRHITKPFSSLQLLNLVGDLLGHEALSAEEES